MSSNVPEWVSRALQAGHEQKIAHGKMIPGRERAPLTQREQLFLQSQGKKEKAPLAAEAVVFESLDKLNSTVGRKG